MSKPHRLDSPVEMSNLETKNDVIQTPDTDRPMSDIGRPSVDIVRRPEAVHSNVDTQGANGNGTMGVEGSLTPSLKSDKGFHLFKRMPRANNKTSFDVPRSGPKTSLDIPRTGPKTSFDLSRTGPASGFTVKPNAGEMIQRPVTEAPPEDGRRTPEPDHATGTSAAHVHSGWTWLFHRGRSDSQSTAASDDDVPVPANSYVSDLEQEIEDCLPDNICGVVNDDQWRQLLQWMPLRYRINDARVAFRASVDGYNLSSLRRKCLDLAPLLIVIKSVSSPSTVCCFFFRHFCCCFLSFFHVFSWTLNRLLEHSCLQRCY